jgi:gliding motility-associated protein GldM
MAHGKETPRQKMIGMMYLVLTALLALNVSISVLDAFKIIDQGLEKTGNTMKNKIDEVYTEFNQANMLNPTKTQVWWNKAEEVRDRADSLYFYIQRLKIKVLSEAERGKTENIIKGDTIFRDEIQAIQDYDTPTRIMIGNDLTDKSEATILRKEVESFREFLLNIQDGEPLPEKLQASIKNSLDTEPATNEKIKNPEERTWEYHKFGHSPLMGFLAIMSSMQIDLRNAESEMVNYLYAQVSAGEVKFNELEAVVVANSNYIISGNPYKADIFIAARDTTQDAKIYVAEGVAEPWNKVVDPSTGEVSYTLKDGIQYSQVEVDKTTGKGVYERSGGGLGSRSWGGIIEITGPGGDPIRRPFYSQYQVAQGSVVVSPTKMNVFYLGVDNPVRISVGGIPDNQIQASASNGKIQRSGNEWVMVPARQGNCIISVAANIDGRVSQIGTESFRVKTVPDPYATVGGLRSGVIAKNVLVAQSGVVATMPEDFDFDLTFQVTEYKVVSIVGGFVRDVSVKGNRFTQEVRDFINGLNKGMPIYFEDIKAVGPDGSVRPLSSINLKLN